MACRGSRPSLVHVALIGASLVVHPARTRASDGLEVIAPNAVAHLSADEPGVVVVRASDDGGGQLRFRTLTPGLRRPGALTQDIDGSPGGMGPLSGGGALLEMRGGIRETWQSEADGLHHAVTVDADLLAGFALDDILVLRWELDRAWGAPSRLETELPVARWLAAGAPTLFEVSPSAIDLVLPRPFRPVPKALADCPPDLVVQCDGAGNLVERQAWLDSFTGSATPGCDDPTRSLVITPGVVLSTIRYDDFRDCSTLTLNGSTGAMGNPVVSRGRRVLRLTNDLGQAGSAFVTNPVVLDPDVSFSAFFTFEISNPMGISDSDGQGADGLVFVVQTVANTAGGSGGGIGYDGIPDSVGVEIDTWDNGAWDDYNGNHVGIDLAGSVDSVVQVPIAQRMNDGVVWNAWVDYDGDADLIEVRVSSSPTRPATPLMTWQVDLTSVLGSNDAFVGFTSGTGGAGGYHDILSFYFNNTRQPFGCGSTGAETIVATFTDDCGNTASCTRLFNASDDAPPALAAGALAPCFATTAAAEAAALAATIVNEPCSPPATLAVTTLGSCDAVVRVSATDACGNVGTLDVPVQIDSAAPSLSARVPGGGCNATMFADAGPDGTALASPGVDLIDPCGAIVRNDRTDGGADATDFYPCGRTIVTFDAEDACGRTATCRIAVVVAPASGPPRVGGALRVRKDATGSARLDWSLAGPGAGPEFAVLRSEDCPHDMVIPPLARGLGAFAWTEPLPGARLICYDVRSIDCSGDLSAD